jgi:hypothetical protein
VVGVPPVEQVDVQGEACGPGQRLEELLGQDRLVLADRLRRDGRLVDQQGPARDVDRDPGQGLLHGHQGGSVAPDAPLLPESLGQGLTDRYAGVLDRVVGVDLEVALGRHLEPESAVPAELIQHVIEERDAGGGRYLAAVQIEIDGDLRLVRDAIDPSSPGHASTSRIASRNASVSSGNPAVTRRQRASRGSLP